MFPFHPKLDNISASSSKNELYEFFSQMLQIYFLYQFFIIQIKNQESHEIYKVGVVSCFTSSYLNCLSRHSHNQNKKFSWKRKKTLAFCLRCKSNLITCQLNVISITFSVFFHDFHLKFVKKLYQSYPTSMCLS